MASIDCLDTVWIPVSDMDRSTAFYRDVLGLPLKMASPYWTSFDLGGLQLALHGPSDGRPAHESYRGWVLSVLTPDLPALRAKLEWAGVRVSAEYHQTPRGAIMDLYDPDGNHIQAMQLGSKAGDLG